MNPALDFGSGAVDAGIGCVCANRTQSVLPALVTTLKLTSRSRTAFDAIMNQRSRTRGCTVRPVDLLHWHYLHVSESTNRAGRERPGAAILRLKLHWHCLNASKSIAESMAKILLTGAFPTVRRTARLSDFSRILFRSRPYFVEKEFSFSSGSIQPRRAGRHQVNLKLPMLAKLWLFSPKFPSR